MLLRCLLTRHAFSQTKTTLRLLQKEHLQVRLVRQNSTKKKQTYNEFISQLPKIKSPKELTVICIFTAPIFYLIYKTGFERPPSKDGPPKLAGNAVVTLYRKMPLKTMSRMWGKMTGWYLPVTLRKPLLGLYVWMFDVNLSEANDADLKHYQNLSEFFRRALKPDARVVDPYAALTSPADGKVLHFGKVENGVVEQVKGVNYSIRGFLGPLPGETSEITDLQYHQRLNLKLGHDLYHCIIYLAPGDYHRFHSPSDWVVKHRRHFPGELLSVNPNIARWIRGLFNFNERVVYSGFWKYGYFSYTAVGATNVGSIKIYFDEEMRTNTGEKYSEGIFHDKIFGSPDGSRGHPIAKGDMIGEFNLGSTIVIIFEAPKDFEFGIKAGQKVKFGEKLGHVADL